jgi:hypothetical protein
LPQGALSSKRYLSTDASTCIRVGIRYVGESSPAIGPWSNIGRGFARYPSIAVVFAEVAARRRVCSQGRCRVVDFADRIRPTLVPSPERETVEPRLNCLSRDEACAAKVWYIRSFERRTSGHEFFVNLYWCIFSVAGLFRNDKDAHNLVEPGAPFSVHGGIVRR